MSKAPLCANTTAGDIGIHTEQDEARGRGKKQDVIARGNYLTFLTCVISKTETAASSLQDKEKHTCYNQTGIDTHIMSLGPNLFNLVRMSNWECPVSGVFKSC